MNQPELATRIALAQIEASKVEEVTIPGRKRSLKISFLHDYTVQKITELLLEREELEKVAREGNADDIMRSAVKHPYFSIKMAALAVLNTPFKIAVFYPLVWRWWAFVRRYNEMEIASVTTAIGKKIRLYCLMSFQVMQCFQATRTDLMTMTKGEAEQSLRELTREG